MRGEGREEKGRRRGSEGRGGLSGNVAEEAFCLKSAPAGASDSALMLTRCALQMFVLLLLLLLLLLSYTAVMVLSVSVKPTTTHSPCQICGHPTALTSVQLTMKSAASLPDKSAGCEWCEVASD